MYVTRNGMADCGPLWGERSTPLQQLCLEGRTERVRYRLPPGGSPAEGGATVYGALGMCKGHATHPALRDPSGSWQQPGPVSRGADGEAEARAVSAEDYC